MKLQELQIRDRIYCLEVNKKNFQPTFTQGTINYVGKKRAATINNTTQTVVDVDVLDSGVLIKTILPADSEYGYFENVLYTANPELIYQEVEARIEQAQIAIDNVEKYKSAKKDYETIRENLKGKVPPSPADVKAIVAEQISAIQSELQSGVQAQLAAFLKQLQPSVQPENKAETKK